MPTGGVVGCSPKNEEENDKSIEFEFDDEDWDPFWETNSGESVENATRVKREEPQSGVLSSLYSKFLVTKCCRGEN